MHYNLYPALRTDKAKLDGNCPIYFFLTAYKTTVKIPSGKYCTPAEWDKTKRKPKTNTQLGVALDTFLSKRISDFKTFITNEQVMGKTVTLDVARSFFDNEKENRADFYKFWENTQREWESKKKYNTVKGYTTTYRILKEIAPKLSFCDITVELVKRFDTHLTVERKNCPNAKFTKHKNFRLFINEAIEAKLMKENPYDKFPFKQAIGNRAFLTLEELEQVNSCDVSKELESVQKAKDFFLFAVYTGLRFGDLMSLKHKAIKHDRLEIVMEKTSNPLMVPLMPQAKEIIEKYSKSTIISGDMRVFPNTANALINRKLKVLMKLAGIDKNISMHSARHTLATLLLHAKTDIVHVKTILGHVDLKTTLVYMKTLNEDLFSSMDNLSKMFEHSKAI